MRRRRGDPTSRPPVAAILSEGSPTPDPADVYQAVRAHEVMLNEATSALERAVVAPLIALNGGAAVAFLALLGALNDDALLTANLGSAKAAAVWSWAAGLLPAGVALLCASKQQSAINKAHRLMREQVE